MSSETSHQESEQTPDSLVERGAKPTPKRTTLGIAMRMKVRQSAQQSDGSSPAASNRPDTPMPQVSSSPPPVPPLPRSIPVAAANAGGLSKSRVSLSPSQIKFIVISVSLGAVLILAMFSLSALLSSWHKCALSKTILERLDSPPRGVHTKPAATSMAKLAGYIHVYDLGFLPLDIKHMRVDKVNGKIILEDDCVRLYFNRNKFNNITGSISNLEWTFMDSNNKILTHAYDNCDLATPSFSHSFPIRYRYSCLGRQAYQCRKYGEDGQLYAVAELVMDSFELEFDGNHEMIYRGGFSKPPYPNSCNE